MCKYFKAIPEQLGVAFCFKPSASGSETHGYFHKLFNSPLERARVDLRDGRGVLLCLVNTNKLMNRSTNEPAKGGNCKKFFKEIFVFAL